MWLLSAAVKGLRSSASPSASPQAVSTESPLGNSQAASSLENIIHAPHEKTPEKKQLPIETAETDIPAAAESAPENCSLATSSVEGAVLLTESGTGVSRPSGSVAASEQATHDDAHPFPPLPPTVQPSSLDLTASGLQTEAPTSVMESMTSASGAVDSGATAGDGRDGAEVAFPAKKFSKLFWDLHNDDFDSVEKGQLLEEKNNKEKSAAGSEAFLEPPQVSVDEEEAFKEKQGLENDADTANSLATPAALEPAHAVIIEDDSPSEGEKSSSSSSSKSAPESPKDSDDNDVVIVAVTGRDANPGAPLTDTGRDATQAATATDAILPDVRRDAALDADTAASNTDRDIAPAAVATLPDAAAPAAGREATPDADASAPEVSGIAARDADAATPDADADAVVVGEVRHGRGATSAGEHSEVIPTRGVSPAKGLYAHLAARPKRSAARGKIRRVATKKAVVLTPRLAVRKLPARTQAARSDPSEVCGASDQDDVSSLRQQATFPAASVLTPRAVITDLHATAHVGESQSPEVSGALDQKDASPVSQHREEERMVYHTKERSERLKSMLLAIRKHRQQQRKQQAEQQTQQQVCPDMVEAPEARSSQSNEVQSDTNDGITAQSPSENQPSEASSEKVIPARKGDPAALEMQLKKKQKELLQLKMSFTAKRISMLQKRVAESTNLNAEETDQKKVFAPALSTPAVASASAASAHQVAAESEGVGLPSAGAAEAASSAASGQEGASAEIATHAAPVASAAPPVLEAVELNPLVRRSELKDPAFSATTTDASGNSLHAVSESAQQGQEGVELNDCELISFLPPLCAPPVISGGKKLEKIARRAERRARKLARKQEKYRKKQAKKQLKKAKKEEKKAKKEARKLAQKKRKAQDLSSSSSSDSDSDSSAK